MIGSRSGPVDLPTRNRHDNFDAARLEACSHLQQKNRQKNFFTWYPFPRHKKHRQIHFERLSSLMR